MLLIFISIYYAMVKKSAHIIFALTLTYYIFGNTSSWLNLTLIEFSSFLGAILPDWDTRYRHRALLHNIFTFISTFILLTFILKILFNILNPVIISISYGIGFLSHMLLDLLTGGVSILYPLTGKRFTLLKIKYDNFAFNTVLILFGLFLFYLKLKLYF